MKKLLKRILTTTSIAVLCTASSVIGVQVYDSVVADETTSEAPGTILLHRKNRLMIACGEGTVIELLTIQPTGKKVMQARDFINGGLRKYL